MVSTLLVVQPYYDFTDTRVAQLCCAWRLLAPWVILWQKHSTWHRATRTPPAPPSPEPHLLRPHRLADALVFFLALAMVALRDVSLSEDDRSHIELALVISFILTLSVAMFYVWLPLPILLAEERRDRRATEAASKPAACRSSRPRSSISIRVSGMSRRPSLFTDQPAEPTSSLFASQSDEDAGDRQQGGHVDSSNGDGVAGCGEESLAARMERLGGMPEHMDRLTPLQQRHDGFTAAGWEKASAITIQAAWRARQVHKVVCARLWRAARVSPSCRRCSVA